MEKDTINVTLPWEGKPSLFNFIQNPQKYSDLIDKDYPDSLPDNFPVRHDIGVYFPGHDDYVDQYCYYEKNINLQFITLLANTLEKCVRGSIKDKVAFYNMIKNYPCVGYFDAFFQELVKRETEITPEFIELARWMVLKATDREVVKIGILMLGFAGDECLPLLRSISKHGEFTYYAAISLSLITPQWEELLIEMIEPLYFFGRLMVIHFLLDNMESEKTRKWCVRNGYKHQYTPNFIINECMRQCDILKDLKEEKWDPELMKAAQAGIIYFTEEPQFKHEYGGEVLSLYLKRTLGKQRGYIQYVILSKLVNLLENMRYKKEYMTNLGLDEEAYSDIWIDVNKEISKRWFLKILKNRDVFATYPYTMKDRCDLAISRLLD